MKTLKTSISPLDRDPRTHPFGMLLVDKQMYDGIDGFAWFKNEADAITYLTAEVWQQLGVTEEQECEARDLYRQALLGKSSLSDATLPQPEHDQERFLIVWLGYFSQIRETSDPYIESIIESFAANPREVDPATVLSTGDNALNELLRLMQMARAIKGPRRQ